MNQYGRKQQAPPPGSGMNGRNIRPQQQQQQMDDSYGQPPAYRPQQPPQQGMGYRGQPPAPLQPQFRPMANGQGPFASPSKSSFPNPQFQFPSPQKPPSGLQQQQFPNPPQQQQVKPLQYPQRDGQQMPRAYNTTNRLPQQQQQQQQQQRVFNGNDGGYAPQRPARPSFDPSMYQDNSDTLVPPRRLDQARYSDYTDAPPSPAASSTSIYIGFEGGSMNSTPTNRDSMGYAITSDYPQAPQPAAPRPYQPPRGGNGQNAMPPRRVSNPPPTRRVASSFYSQTGIPLVSPIPEETSSIDRHNSFASSHVIPSNWGSPGVNSDAFSPVSRPSGDLFSHPEMAAEAERGRNRSGFDDYSDSSSSEDEDGRRGKQGGASGSFESDRGLVRQASMGKKTKPKVTQIGRVNSTSERSPSPTRGTTPPRDEQRSITAPKTYGSGNTSTSNVNAGPSSSDESLSMGYRPSSAAFGRVQQPPADRSSPTLVIPEKAAARASPASAGRDAAGTPVSAKSKESPNLGRSGSRASRASFRFSFAWPKRNSVAKASSEKSSEAGFSPLEDRDEMGRPGSALGGRKGPRGLRLNMEAVREAEQRGSLTSLPDLIRRATKLAAVLETGRPDSRWGMRGSYMDQSSTTNDDRNDSISDILASFPPPAASNPQYRNPNAIDEYRKSSFPGSGSAWPLPADFQSSGTSLPTSIPPKRRKLCGLPLWAFILLVLLALLVIAAAVIVPLQLVMLSRNSENAPSASDIVTQCRQQLSCRNGGVNVARTGFCGCVCTGGFSGASCDMADNDGCEVWTPAEEAGLGAVGTVGGIANATVGEAVVRVFGISSVQFNIGLERPLILSKFSSENKSCVAQNALVTFVGSSGRQRRSRSGGVSRLAKRQEQEPTLLDNDNDNGLGDIPSVIPPPTAPSATLTIPPQLATPTTTPPPPRNPTSSTPQLPLAPSVVDFARVAVLFIVQNSSFAEAVEARNEFEKVFLTGRDFGVVELPNGAVADLDGLRLRGGNGRVVGGGGFGNGRFGGGNNNNGGNGGNNNGGNGGGNGNNNGGNGGDDD